MSDDPFDFSGGSGSPSFDAPRIDFGGGKVPFDAPKLNFVEEEDTEPLEDPLADFVDPSNDLATNVAAMYEHLAGKVEEKWSQWRDRTLLVAFNTTGEKLSFLDAIGWKYVEWAPSHTSVHGNFVARYVWQDFPEGDCGEIGFDVQDELREEAPLFTFDTFDFSSGSMADVFNIDDESMPVFTPNDEDDDSPTFVEEEEPEEKKKHHRMRYMLNQMKSTYWRDYFDGTFWCGLWFNTEAQLADFCARTGLTQDEFGCVEGHALADVLGVEVEGGTFRDKKPMISQKMAKLAVESS